MSDRSTSRKAKVVPFLDRVELDRVANFNALIVRAKILKLEGFEDVQWSSPEWKIKGGRLLKQSGKNTKSVVLRYFFPPKLGDVPLDGGWAEIAKTLMTLRFHRKHQATSNQRNFITAVGYIAHAANELSQDLSRLTPEVLDLACRTLGGHYSGGTAYNIHKAVAEFSGHCDSNGLCRSTLNFKYAGMKRPENTGGVGHKRLDDPEVFDTVAEKLIDPSVFRILGELYQNVPGDHKYRFYVLLLTLLACLGRRFSEISLLPFQSIKKDYDGREHIEYFPRKVSQGDVFTPKRKLYMPSVVLPIVRDVIEELDDICVSARESADEMHRNRSVDLRFIENLDYSKRLYKEDLKELGISPTVLGVTGWVRKNGYAYPDTDALTKKGITPARPIYFTTRVGVEAYCSKDFDEGFLAAIHLDQNGQEYFLKDLLLVRHQGLSSGTYSHWIATQCTHSMMTTFLRYLPGLAKEYASKRIEVDFTSHHFRHTLNTLLDEGGLSELIQTEWFGRSNPKDTKAYQHTSREKRALMLREEIKKGRVGGRLPESIKLVPVDIQDAVLKARVHAVHDVGTGFCVHNFAQTPCQRHLQCTADCDDYVWAKDDNGRLDEQKRQYALTSLARETAEQRLASSKPKKSSDWLRHNEKKLKTLSEQLEENGVVDFDPKVYLEGLENG